MDWAITVTVWLMPSIGFFTIKNPSEWRYDVEPFTLINTELGDRGERTTLELLLVNVAIILSSWVKYLLYTK